MLYIPIFIFGLIFGSFASLIIHRVHNHERGIWLGRSKCPKCSHKLGAMDLIPLFSFLICGTKCRYCKKPISFFYPLLELVMGSAFVLTAFLTGMLQVTLLIFYLFITFIFVVLAFYDFLYKEVPDEIVLPSFVISFVFGGLAKIYSYESLLIGVAVPAVFFGVLFLGSKGRWLGGGDIRIGALMGALLGWPNILTGLFLGYIFGAIYSLAGLASKKLTRKSQIPFAPFLLAGAYIAIFWGQRILDWYLGML
jgi:prepilin signal peptidase PulO-like enzyme (type II secretory pathway)